MNHSSLPASPPIIVLRESLQNISEVRMTSGVIGVAAFLFLEAFTHGLILSNDTSLNHANGMETVIKNSSIFDDTTKSLEIKLTTTPSMTLEANFLLPESCADYKVISSE